MFVIAFAESNRITLEDSNKAQIVLTQNKSEYYVLDFYADWCKPCKQMDRETWSDTTVKNLLSQYRDGLTKVNTDYNKEMVAQYKVKGIPCVIITDKEGKEIKRFTGYKTRSYVMEFLK